jgi:hypothetical protein
MQLKAIYVEILEEANGLFACVNPITEEKSRDIMFFLHAFCT